MMDMTARDQGTGGVALLARDSSQPHYFPAASTAAARVELHARDANKGIDTAFKVAEGKPGGEFSVPNAVLSDRNLLFTTISYSASNIPSTDLARARWYPMSVTVSTGTAAGIDEHVPTVTIAPTVTKSDAGNFWYLLTPMPDEYGATLTDCEVWVEEASDATVFTIWPDAPSPTHLIQQTTYAAKARYRFRNQSTEDSGDGRGWSAWSPYANAAEIGASVPDPSPTGALSTFDSDPEDSRAGVHKVVLD
jgi:hypothetical protein